MKKENILLALILTSLSFAFTTIEKDHFSVDTDNSKLAWLAKKVTGQHDGTIKIKGGSLEVTDGNLSGGSFTIDMSTITVLDITNKGQNAKLTGHLNSADFFDVEKFKESAFTITAVKQVKSEKGNYEITGDLTIKGKTFPNTFIADVQVADTKVVAKANIVFDRSKYDVRYGSGSFFDNLGNKAINDDVEMTINLVANKQ